MFSFDLIVVGADNQFLVEVFLYQGTQLLEIKGAFAGLFGFYHTGSQMDNIIVAVEHPGYFVH